MLLLLVAIALAAPEMIPESVWAAVQGQPEGAAADFEIPLKEGGSFQMTAHRGKPVLLSFWASWCSPCRRELPALSAWAKEHPELTVLAVNVDRTAEPAQAFLERTPLDLQIAYDPDAKHLGQYGITSMPTMLLFDGQGQLSWRHVGFSEEKGLSELEAAVRELK